MLNPMLLPFARSLSDRMCTTTDRVVGTTDPSIKCSRRSRSGYAVTLLANMDQVWCSEVFFASRLVLWADVWVGFGALGQCSGLYGVVA